MRRTLLDALSSCADTSRRSGAHRFLAGLSADELQFIAEFLGACVLESSTQCPCTRTELGVRIAAFQSRRNQRGIRSHDQEHKMILLLEYLCRSGIRQVPRIEQSMSAGG